MRRRSQRIPYSILIGNALSFSVKHMHGWKRTLRSVATIPILAVVTFFGYACHAGVLTTGVVELVSLCGYYTLVSFLLGAFAVPLPPGAPLTWGSSSSEAG